MTPSKPKPATVAEIRAIVGEIDDDAVLEIWKTEATVAEIEQAVALARDDYWNNMTLKGKQNYSTVIGTIQEILQVYNLEPELD